MVADVISRASRKLSAVQRTFSAASESIAEIRGEIAALRAEYQRVATAPLASVSEVVAHIDTMLDQWDAVGRSGCGVSVDGIIRNAMAGHPPRIALHQHATLGHVVTLLVLLKPLLRETLVAKVEAAYADTPAGLTAEERKRELARLDEQLLALERAEEQALQVAEANGLPIDRREDADVRAVLGL